MILSEREVETLFCSSSNQCWSTLVWCSKSAETISKCNLVGTVIVDLDCISNKDEFLQISKRWLAKGAKILHLSGLEESMLICRLGQDAIVEIGREMDGTRIYKRIMAAEDLYALQKYIDRLICEGCQYELQEIQTYFDAHDFSGCINDFVREHVATPVGKSGVGRVLDFPRKSIDNPKSRQRRERVLGNVVQLSRNLDKFRSSEDAYYVRLQPTTEDESGNFTHSLIAHPDVDLTSWKLAGEEVNLKRNFRYLFIWQDAGRLAFVRVVKTRLTFFSTVVEYPQYWEKELSETGFYLKSFDFAAQELEMEHSNLQARVSKIYDNDYYINCWFDGQTVMIRQILDSDKAEVLLKTVEDFHDEITSALVNALLAPFKYNKNLTGVQAHQFFDGLDIDDPFELKLVEVAPDTFALSCEYDPAVDNAD